MTSQSPESITNYLESLSIQGVSPSSGKEKEIQETCLQAQFLRQIAEIIPDIQIQSSRETIISMRDELLLEQEFTSSQVEQVLFAAITAKQTIPAPAALGPRIGPNGLYK